MLAMQPSPRCTMLFSDSRGWSGVLYIVKACWILKVDSAFAAANPALRCSDCRSVCGLLKSIAIGLVAGSFTQIGLVWIVSNQHTVLILSINGSPLCTQVIDTWHGHRIEHFTHRQLDIEVCWVLFKFFFRDLAWEAPSLCWPGRFIAATRQTFAPSDRYHLLLRQPHPRGDRSNNCTWKGMW